MNCLSFVITMVAIVSIFVAGLGTFSVEGNISPNSNGNISLVYKQYYGPLGNILNKTVSLTPDNNELSITVGNETRKGIISNVTLENIMSSIEQSGFFQTNQSDIIYDRTFSGPFNNYNLTVGIENTTHTLAWPEKYNERVAVPESLYTINQVIEKVLQEYPEGEVVMSSFETIPSNLKVGDEFKVQVMITNNNDESITFVGDMCGGSPLNIHFDSIVEMSNKIHCLAISYFTLNSNQSVLIEGKDYEVFKAKESGNTNATITFQYALGNSIFENNQEQRLITSVFPVVIQ